MTIVNPLQPPLPPKQQTSLWESLTDGSLSLALSSTISQSQQPVLIITPDSMLAMRLEYELTFFLEKQLPIILFPDWETLPYDRFSAHQDIISSRLKTLTKLPLLSAGAVITPIQTLMHRISPREFLEAHSFVLQHGDPFNIDTTRKRLEKVGYYCVNQVREHGEFAVRGSIMDIFPMGTELPFRIDLFDDEIDSIRTFAVDTQRSLDKVEKIELLPAKEFPLSEEAIERFRQHWRSQFTGNPLNCPIYQDISEGICPPGIEYYLPFFFENTSTLFDYLPKNTLIIYLQNTEKKAQEFWQEINARYEQRSHDINYPILKPKQIFIEPTEVQALIEQQRNIKIELTLEEEKPYSLEKNNFDKMGRVLFCAETAGRREVLLPLLHARSIYPKSYETWHAFLADKEQYGITIAALDQGFTISDPHVTLITEAQLFGKRVMQRRRRKESVQDPDLIIRDLIELQIGSPIVHIDHGVGRYLGLQTLQIGDLTSEFLTLEYASSDKLYVPVSSLHLISRYTGSDSDHAPLHKLGTEQWQRAKHKATEKVRDVAAELLDLYARRAAHIGLACNPPDENYTAFAAAFPFEETPDQQRAIQDTLNDMVLEKPMDRLICGDVGFGKTEVAMRAAFLAAQNNKQTSVLVPTTLLAEQHFQNFSDRFAKWPIRIESLSRFKSKKEQLDVIKNLEEGKVDIVIGTHKLLQENIKFKSLGLLIIDEEHRFGVQQKEKLKSLRSSVDILTLTATPIPRTLNLAFSGMRDLSLITTPPARRLSIKTFLHEYDDQITQEAIYREILRGGQVYFLHNDVATIEKTARDLEKLVPEARVGIAHGQMHERSLEKVMSDFYHRRFNVLVCTTIIESGIDVPSANTIIIHRADKFGLSQLHQLRGRVGRSHHQAYAYLFIPSHKTLTPDAKKRLDAITAYEDLGIGFTLATHDLEIRGAGELLGEEQSGEMHAIGFSLYMDLLQRAVNALKSGKVPDLDISAAKSTEIDLQISALIPDHYLPDPHLRLQLYKRIANTKNSRELDEIQVEMIDRFGLLPDQAKNLFAVTLIKQRAEELGINKIEANSKGGKIEFSEKPSVDPMRIIHLIQKESQQFKLDGPTRLRFTLPQHEGKERIELVDNIMNKISS